MAIDKSHRTISKTFLFHALTVNFTKLYNV